IPRMSLRRVKELLTSVKNSKIVVVGDLMLDEYVWGNVSRISPEAPVPVVEFVEESFMPGGAANVARNLATLGAKTALFGVVGKDFAAQKLLNLLENYKINCDGIVSHQQRKTSIKTRIIAARQQVVRLDRETKDEIDEDSTEEIFKSIQRAFDRPDAIILGDYGKGVVTQKLVDKIREYCRANGIWLSLDPKPVHRLDVRNMSLITPNRKEAFELAGYPDGSKKAEPLLDKELMNVAETLLNRLSPALLLITLGEQGMLLCQRNCKPLHIPTVAREVFDVSGAGDTVIAAFTLAIAAGASPVEAAVFSNHAAGVVVAKVGTAAVSPEELLQSFRDR
ncbi:MAG: D-glycero-beta-D-manno-heptose-7-phosphate kinase, partial [Verrucomicrobiia bacterium]